MAADLRPAALRLVAQGASCARHSKKARTEPVAKLGLGDPPATLTPEQVVLWQRIERDAPAGLLTRVDADLIASYVMLLDARNATARLFNQTNGAILVRGTGGSSPAWVENPLLKELRRLTTELLMMQTQLGYSPASRTRIAVQVEGHAADPLDRFFGAA
jgi:P27 family predicted phage terminase small subunit